MKPTIGFNQQIMFVLLFHFFFIELLSFLCLQLMISKLPFCAVYFYVYITLVLKWKKKCNLEMMCKEFCDRENARYAQLQMVKEN